MKNHLIIGLGGTGGKIIRALRKKVYEQFRELDPPNVRLGYLYVDSNREMMEVNDPTWKILGRSVQLPPASQFPIAGNNLAATLDNLEAFPGISPWLGSRDDWRSILGSAEAANIVGGQKRRLGRFLFACKARDFAIQLSTTVNQLTTMGESGVTFHACCGLAGGTGSGSLIDVLSQIRKMYHDRSCKILVYAMLPDEHPQEGWAGPNYHANGYAALLELNALSVGRLHPHDVTSKVSERVHNQDPFNCCYLFTNENQAGFKIDVDKALPEVVASFLFEKTVTNSRVTWDALRRAEDFETGAQAITPENDVSNTKPERSRRFFTFGIKQISYPEEEILEYLTYLFAEQAALQLTYNAWTESGYSGEPQNRSYNEFVQQPETLVRWKLSDAHVLLSEGILPDEISNKRWKTIPTDWSVALARIQQDIRSTPGLPDLGWLDELAKRCEARFTSTYRGEFGVARFYATKNKDLPRHVAEIRRIIEADLFTEWQNGAKSICDIAQLLKSLREFIVARAELVSDKIAKNDQDIAAARDKLDSNKAEWAKAGIIAGWLGKRDRLFAAAGMNYQTFYIASTLKEGWLFAGRLLRAVANDLDGMVGEIGVIAQTLEDGLKKFRAERDARCSPTPDGEQVSGNIRLYDAARVREIANLMVRDESEQRVQAKRVRDALVLRTGENPNFTKFRERVQVSDLVDSLEHVCEESVRAAHANLVQSARTKERLLSVSIIEKLRDRYAGSPDQLRAFLSRVVTQGMNYLTFNPAEVERHGPGIPNDATCTPTFTVIMPELEQHREFCQTLRTQFGLATAGRANIVINNEKQNIITLVNITHGFPIRFVKPAEDLRKKYEQRMHGEDRARAALELHSEGDGTDLPALFPENLETAKRNAIPYLILGKVLGLIVESSGKLHLVTKDADGFDNEPILLGKDIVDAYDRLALRHSHTIRDAVMLVLGDRERCTPEVREASRAAVVSLVESIKGQRGVGDSVYKLFLDAGKKSVQVLKQEA